MSGLAVRAWARGRFLFVFSLLFSLCQMGGLERREQEDRGNISSSASQTSTTAMNEETWSLWEFGEFGESIVLERMLCSLCWCWYSKMSSWWCQLKCCERASSSQVSGASELNREEDILIELCCVVMTEIVVSYAANDMLLDLTDLHRDFSISLLIFN